MKLAVGAVSALVAGLLAGGTSAQAHNHRSFDLDLREIPGGETRTTSGIILAWMDGYYRDENDPPVIDTEKFVANAKKLGEYCAAHPDIGIVTAADELFAK